MDGERERFVAQLRERGEDDATIDGYLRIAERVTTIAGGWSVLPKHVDAAMRHAEQGGATPQQLANLKRVGDELVAFRRASAPPPSATSSKGRCTACGGPISVVIASATPSAGASTTGAIASMAGAGASFLMVRLFGCFGVLVFLLTLAAIGSLWEALTRRAMCVSCGHRAANDDLTPELQGELSNARRGAWLRTLGLAVGAAAAFVLWVVLAVVAFNS